MSDCIFCKIIKGEIPSKKLLETDSVIAILDIGPMSPGHSLVIPKKHCETFLELPENLYENTLKSVKTLAAAILSATNADGFNLFQNNGRCAGQAVNHVHFHIVPRKERDSVSFAWKPGSYKEGEMDQIAEKILLNIKL